MYLLAKLRGSVTYEQRSVQLLMQCVRTKHSFELNIQQIEACLL